MRASTPFTSTWRDGKIYTTPGAAPIPLAATLLIIDPATGEPLLSGMTPRPGADPWTAGFRSSNPAVASVNGAVDGSGSTAKFQPTALGEAEITVVQPPGFRASPASTLRVVVVDKL